MALTETHTLAKVNPFSSFSFNHLSPSAYSSARTKVTRVAIITMNPNTIIITTYSGLNGRLLVAEILLLHQRDSIKVAVLYAPDSGKGQAAAVKFFNKCHKHIPKNVKLIMEDFN